MYCRKVKIYHPDQVTGLAPEYHELAEESMKVINAVYKALMSPLQKGPDKTSPNYTLLKQQIL